MITTRTPVRATMAAAVVLSLGLAGCAATVDGKPVAVRTPAPTASSATSFPSAPPTSASPSAPTSSSAAPSASPTASADPFAGVACARLKPSLLENSKPRTSKLPALPTNAFGLSMLVKGLQGSDGAKLVYAGTVVHTVILNGKKTKKTEILSYACFDHEADFGIGLALNGLDIFYAAVVPKMETAVQKQHSLGFGRKGTKNVKSADPKTILVVLSDGLTVTSVARADAGSAEKNGEHYGTVALEWTG